MSKASRLVEQLETQLERAQAALKKKDERLKRLSEQLRELGAQYKRKKQQTVILASHLSKYVMHTMSTKEWLEWSERTAKEAMND